MKQDLIKSTSKKLTEIAEVLYKGDVKTGIAAMGLVISDLAEIISDIQDEETKGKILQDVLTPALKAMEESDGTMLADIISYELLEILGALER